MKVCFSLFVVYSNHCKFFPFVLISLKPLVSKPSLHILYSIVLYTKLLSANSVNHRIVFFNQPINDGILLMFLGGETFCSFWILSP